MGQVYTRTGSGAIGKACEGVRQVRRKRIEGDEFGLGQRGGEIVSGNGAVHNVAARMGVRLRRIGAIQVGRRNAAIGNVAARMGVRLRRRPPERPSRSGPLRPPPQRAHWFRQRTLPTLQESLPPKPSGQDDGQSYACCFPLCLVRWKCKESITGQATWSGKGYYTRNRFLLVPLSMQRILKVYVYARLTRATRRVV
jgi:hypothetical protein